MNFSRITNELLVGTTPDQSDFERLHAMGVRLVINMRLWWGRPPSRRQPPMQYMRLRTFDSPLVPIPVSALIRGTQAALQVMDDGGSVYTHCSRGRHRSAAMAAAILIGTGLGPQAAIQLIKQGRPEAEPEAYYIRPQILGFERAWRGQSQRIGGDPDQGEGAAAT